MVLAFNGEDALNSGRSPDLDVILLDVTLPLMDGFTVIRNLRAEHFATPTIMLTARDAMSDVVRGLDLGADDYLTKPFTLDVLLARMRAVSRRGPALQSETLALGDLTLDRKTHQLTRGVRTVSLTRTEFLLLEKLIRNGGSIVMRDSLVEAGWGVGAEVNDSTLYVFVRSLRNKITVEGEPQLLHTARGIGYTLRALAH